MFTDRYFSSLGLSRMFFKKRRSKRKAFPPSPPVRYRDIVLMAVSIVSAGGTPGGAVAECVACLTGMAFSFTAATLVVLAGCSAEVSLASYFNAEGLYPSAPSTLGRTPLLALRSSLSLAISARRRSRSRLASNFSRFIFSASIFLIIRSRSSCVWLSFCPLSRRSFSRMMASCFSFSSLSRLRRAAFSFISCTFVALSSSVSGVRGIASLLRTM
mmetsp:Transcript_21686/g.31560  ORF Transcript_21686/g.31560 Transcript_21686/m.31560 type:complete len:215 (+) Transcript_21686:299-943(+)